MEKENEYLKKKPESKKQKEIITMLRAMLIRGDDAARASITQYNNVDSMETQKKSSTFFFSNFIYCITSG